MSGEENRNESPSVVQPEILPTDASCLHRSMAVVLRFTSCESRKELIYKVLSAMSQVISSSDRFHQVQALANASPAAELRERAEAILWIRTQMAKHGVTAEDLMAAGCFARPERPVVVRYRNADGQTWSGEGIMPDWLRRAVNAGQSVEHFRVGSRP